MDMGQKIYNLRIQKGLTLEELGNMVGVGKSTVRKWENGMIANMKRDKILKVSEALDTTPAYLMGWINSSDEDGLLDYFDSTLDKAILLLEKYGFSVLQTDSSYDDTIVIKNKKNQLIKTMTEGELVGSYEKIKIHNLPRTVNNLLNMNDFILSSEEKDHINKYRDLDSHGKEMVDFTLQKEWERSTAEQKVTPIVLKEDATYYVNAAHPIEDSSVEDKQFDEGIMDDENF